MSKCYEFGSPSAPVVLIQPTDDRELSVIENEVREIRRLTDADFRLTAVRVDRWNHDLSPWPAPAVFGTEGFGGGAEAALKELLSLCGETDGPRIIGGYSLAGLFSLWAAYRTDAFSAVAAASPSVWFPGFIDYMKANPIRCRAVYLSLGDREERTRNPVMSTVGTCVREARRLLGEAGTDCTLEWNSGNHFRDPDLRTARAFAWALNRIKKSAVTGAM